MACLRRPAVYVLSNVKGLANELRSRLKDVQIEDISTTSEAPDVKTKESVVKQLEGAELVIADPSIICHYVYQLPNIRWVMSTWAGINALCSKLDSSKPCPSFTLTRFTGSFGIMMAEYTLCQMIAYERKLFTMHEYQKEKNWNDCTEKVRNFRQLSELTLGVMGVGDIGSEIARLAKGFGMKVEGLVRKPEGKRRNNYVDKYRTMEDLDGFLGECDYICNVLPSTAVTRGLLTPDILACCKHKRPVFMNIGRGDVITENTLLQALDNGLLRHAILDVFEKEPLPPSSELWHHQNVTITPHMSGISFSHQVADLFCKQYDLYCRGETLEHQADLSEEY